MCVNKLCYFPVREDQKKFRCEQICAGKCLLKAVNKTKSTDLYIFASFCGVKAPTIASFDTDVFTNMFSLKAGLETIAHK